MATHLGTDVVLEVAAGGALQHDVEAVGVEDDVEEVDDVGVPQRLHAAARQPQQRGVTRETNGQVLRWCHLQEGMARPVFTSFACICHPGMTLQHAGNGQSNKQHSDACTTFDRDPGGQQAVRVESLPAGWGVPA